jgi:peptidoglycan/xylan/chitin deacetylase (PgdA/CDA1 family)
MSRIKLEIESKLTAVRRDATVRALCTGSRVISYVVGAALILLTAQPAFGRWEIPDYGDQADHGGWVSEEAAKSQAAGEEVELPERADVPILMYHYVSELPPDPDRYRVDLTVLPEDFKAQLQYLADAGYHTITLTDLYLHFTRGYPLPEKPIVLTFDDGYRDAYEVAFPLLLDHGFTATFFVLATPAHFEWENYLTWGQMSEMAQAGMEIQAHGRDHVDLRGASYEYLVYQVLGIQEAIAHHVGEPSRFFCYPSGRYDDNVVAVLESAGYWGAVTTEWGRTQTREELFLMPRIRVRGTGTLESFIDSIEG